MSRIIAIIWIVLGVCQAAAQDVYLQNRRTPFRQVAAVPGGVGTDPTNVAGLYAQWVADDIDLANGAAISNWTDRVSSWTVSGTNSTYLPYATNNVWNGHDAVVYTTDYLFESNTTFTSYWQGQDMAYTIISVAKRANTNNAYTVVCIGTNNSWSMTYFNLAGNFRVYDDGISYSGTATNDTNPHVYVFVDHGTTVSTWIDRYLDQTNKAADQGLNNPHYVSIGANVGAAGSWATLLVGHVAEVLIYTNAVSGANVTNIVDFLVDKYGITPF